VTPRAAFATAPAPDDIVPAERERRLPGPRVLLVGGPDVDARLDLMRELRDVVHIGAVGSAPDLGSRFRAEGFDYWRYPLSRRVAPARDLVALHRLTRVFREVRPAIVHAFDTKPGIWGVLAARATSVPVVVATVTGLGSLFGSDAVGVRVVRGVYCALQRFACRLSDCTVFQNSDDLLEFVARRLVSRRKAYVIPGSGVPTRVFDPGLIPERERRRTRTELGVAHGDVMVTMVSRVIRSKGVLEFMEVARHLTAGDTRTRFVLIGAADDDSLDRLAAKEQAELRHALIWPGPRRDVRSVLAATDVFVLPSSLREGVPRALLEAASMALPIVTTCTPGCDEVVRDDVNGYLVPAHDIGGFCAAIRRLVADPDRRRRFGAASRRRAVERFDVTTIASQTWALYRSLLDARRAAAPGGTA